MLRFAEERARKEYKKWLELTVIKTNTPAQRLYAKLGFSFKKERKYSFVLKKRVN